MEPTTPPLSWEEFLRKVPDFSIALDGFVADCTKLDLERHIANFNHHENCNRLATNATCGQILMANRMGLFQAFRKNQEVEINVYVNDCDEDVCMSIFLLKYGYLTEHAINPNLNKLVSICDSLDRTGGVYPFPKDLPILKNLAWIFEPYRRSRQNGTLYNKDKDEYISILEDVENRIMKFIVGEAKQINVDTRYDVLGGGKGWSLVHEIGSQARTGMVSDGIQAYVSAKQRQSGQWQYTIARISPFIPFPVLKIFNRLNEVENLKDNKDCWGGGDLIGGSPRVNGSSLSPKEIESIINEFIQK